MPIREVSLFSGVFGACPVPSRVIFPIGTDRPLQRPTLVNHLLVMINLFVFCIMLVGTGFEGSNYEKVVDWFGLSRQHHEWWRFISYDFIHAGPWHLLGNMVMLWVFGPNVEDRFGRIGYLAFYLCAGAVAGAAHLLSGDAMVIGASGAISGVTGAFLVLFPRTVVRTLVFFLLIGVFNIPALWFIAFAIARDVLGAGLHGSNVSYAAHLGGYALGIAVSLALLASHVLAREDYDMFFMIKQARRRNAINEALRESQQRLQPTGRKGGRVPSESADVPIELAKARAALSGAVSGTDRSGLAALYQSLIKEFESARRAQPELAPTLDVLSRRAQLDLANRLFELGQHALAARAYRGFLTLYEKDSESGAVRVMLALLMVRYLEQRQQARAVLENAIAALKDKDAEHTALARTLLSEIEAPPATTA